MANRNFIRKNTVFEEEDWICERELELPCGQPLLEEWLFSIDKMDQVVVVKHSEGVDAGVAWETGAVDKSAEDGYARPIVNISISEKTSSGVEMLTVIFQTAKEDRKVKTN
jgi:hypothetical protein